MISTACCVSTVRSTAAFADGGACLVNSKASSRALTAEEVAAQTGIILVAGQDTTVRSDLPMIILITVPHLQTNTIAFGLVELAKQPYLQEQLRNEIHSSLGASRTPAYGSMPLLNAFIKVEQLNFCMLDGNGKLSIMQELLRLYPAEPLTDRIALEDTVLPLTESITSPEGETISQIPVRKGQIVTLGIGSYQRYACQVLDMFAVEHGY